MKKFAGVLFCSDLDGTLLSNDGSISEENLKAIKYFKAEGGMFTFVTGRMPFTANKFYDMVKPNAPCVCVNGGGIYDYAKGEYLWTDSLIDEARELVEYAQKQLPEISFHMNAPSCLYFNNDSVESRRFCERSNQPLKICEYRDVKEPVLKVVFTIDDKKLFNELIELLNSHEKAEKFDFIRSELSFYEILPKGVSKGSALKRLTEILCIDKNKTIAIGDYDNDISMIKVAKIGVAVANAQQSVKTAADMITVSNDENAIAKIIEMLDSGAISL